MVKRILLVLALIFVVIQFFGVDTSVPETNAADDFLTIAKPAEPVATIISSACYDCHSYKTKYPWYSNIAPLSWWMQDHVDHGRDELNFSTWAQYTPQRADHKLEEAIELVGEEEMPLPSYTWAHAEARLTDSQREELSTWFASYRKTMISTDNENGSDE